MNQLIFEHLRMSIQSDGESIRLTLSISSGFVEFEATVTLTEQDRAVILSDPERAAFLHSVLHHEFQIQKTFPKIEQRICLDKILHASKANVELFLTELDHGNANGAVSNMVRITCGREQKPMRDGNWFNN